MIITNLIGGLGNQMFQYACGRALALHLGQSFKVATDQFDGYALHQGLELERVFAISIDTATRSDLSKVIGRWRTSVVMRRLLAHARWPLVSGRHFVVEPGVGFWDGLQSRCTQDTYLHGYWQSDRYFDDQAAAIRADFAWRHPLQGRNAAVAHAIEAAPSSISVHVRRGDYVSSSKNSAVYATCSPEYYLAALDRLSIQSQQAHIFAFSDDPQWVAQALAPHCPGLVLVDHNRGTDSHIDMRLMSLCRHHVIANSSFSWWGAWLDARVDKRVVAPARWFANGRDGNEMLPRTWERL